MCICCPALIEDRGPDPLTDLLAELGGWPVLDAKWNESKFDLEKTVAKLRLYGAPALISTGVDVDLKQSDKHAIYVSLFHRPMIIVITTLIFSIPV